VPDLTVTGGSPAKSVTDRRLAPFRERLPAVWCDVRSLSGVDPGVLSADTHSENGCSALFGYFPADGGEFLSVQWGPGCSHHSSAQAFRKPLLSANASQEFVAKKCHGCMCRPPTFWRPQFRRFLDEHVADDFKGAVDFLGDNDCEE